MPKQFSIIQKCAFGFAALFLGVYLLDFVPGIMDQNRLMFGLFHMTLIVDIGHLALGLLALLAGLNGPRISRIYFWVLGIWYTIDVVTFFFGHVHSLRLIVNVLTNLPHFLIVLAAYWIALDVDNPKTKARAV